MAILLVLNSQGNTMSYSCDNDYYYNDDDYNNGCCNNDGLAYLIAFYPFIPFTVIGYEVLDALSHGINAAKWGGAVFGGIVGWYFYIHGGKYMIQKMNIHYLLVILMGYSFGTGLFYILGSFYPDNRVVKMAWSAGKAIAQWAISVS
jgi:hypothetical protein